MNKHNLKNELRQQLKKIGWRLITTIILTLTAIITVWVYAAFVEPTVGPNDSDQDFAQNILGANNADNDFNSSLVTANKDGSIIERAEYIINRMTTQGEWYSLECDDSTTTATSTCYVDDTAKYVDTNACSAASNTGYCFMNTATFSAMDSDLAAANIKPSTTIFGVTGTAKIKCRGGYSGYCWTDYCTIGTDCNNNCSGGGYQWTITTSSADANGVKCNWYNGSAWYACGPGSPGGQECIIQ